MADAAAAAAATAIAATDGILGSGSGSGPGSGAEYREVVGREEDDGVDDDDWGENGEEEYWSAGSAGSAGSAISAISAISAAAVALAAARAVATAAAAAAAIGEDGQWAVDEEVSGSTNGFAPAGKGSGSLPSEARWASREKSSTAEDCRSISHACSAMAEGVGTMAAGSIKGCSMESGRMQAGWIMEGSMSSMGGASGGFFLSLLALVCLPFGRMTRGGGGSSSSPI